MAQTTFTVSEQVGFAFNALTVSDGVASAVAITDSGTGVSLAAGSAFGENIGANDTLVNISYGFDGADNMLGSQSDYLFGGAEGDTLRGRTAVMTS